MVPTKTTIITSPSPFPIATVVPEAHLVSTYNLILAIVAIMLFLLAILIVFIVKRRRRYNILNGNNGEELEMSEPFVTENQDEL